MCFKIDWVSLIVGRKFTVFALFFFATEGNFQGKAPTGGQRVGLYLEGRFNRGFFFCITGFLGAYVRRGLFSKFYGTFL